MAAYRIDVEQNQLGESGRGRVTLSNDAIAALQHYAWPGNVRELSNLLERLAVLHPGGTVRAGALPARYRAGIPESFNVLVHELRGLGLDLKFE